MTCDTVWGVTQHPSGQYDLWCHLKFFITQPPNFTPMIIVLDAIKNLDKSLEDISERMCLKRLKMNPTKTEFSLFGSRHQTAKCTVTSINVVGEGIARMYISNSYSCTSDKCSMVLLTITLYR